MTAHSHQFVEPRIDCTTFEPRYRAALGTASEADVFMALAQEMETAGEPLWALFYDLATSSIDREEALAEIEADFAAYHAREAFNDAAYGFECATGKSWEASPSLASYAAMLDRGQRDFNRNVGRGA